MPHPDDDRSVDFVVGGPGPDGGDGRPDEELEHEVDTRRRRRLRIELGGGALALLAIVLVLRASLSTDRPSGTPSTSPTPSFSYPVVPGPERAGPLPIRGKIAVPPSETALPAALPDSVPTRHGSDPRKCPGLRCRSSFATVPGAIRAAVETAVPESSVEGVETVRLRGHHHVLWFRSIVARAASEQLVVRIQAPAHSDRSRVSFAKSDVGATTTVETSLGPWHVVVQIIDPTGGEGDVTTMSRLARDPRIVSG